MRSHVELERYREISILGRGGMATVSLAEDEVLGRPVALKRLSAGAFTDAETGESDAQGLVRLRREALLGASLSHPNLVSIYDIVESGDGQMVIVMEYIPGETLARRLAREGRLEPEQALPILDGVAAGLRAIHRRGVVHRDLKPANVLLGPDGQVKLADFGIATGAELTRITSSGAVIGTYRYMAPEQLEDAPSAASMDIYALAVLAFEMLSGTRARNESNPVALAHAIATQPPPDLREAWPEAPADAAAVLRRAMSREPGARPARATELTARLRAALEDQRTREIATPRPPAAEPAVAVMPAPALAGPQVRPPAPPREAVSASATTNRRPVWVALVALLLGAGVVVAVIVGSGSSRSPHRTAARIAVRHHATAAATRPHATSTAPVMPTSATASTAAATGGSATGASVTHAVAATRPATAPSTPSATPSATASSGSATTPAGAVESFYHLAAAHSFPQAWALADSSLRDQLGGYGSFEAGQAQDRAVNFDVARVTNQGAGAATVAVETTSIHTDGTYRCSGSVDLLQGSRNLWLLHQIHITCSPT